MTTLQKGRFQVIEKPTDATYKLIDLNKKETVQHRNNLLSYYPKKHALRKITPYPYLSYTHATLSSHTLSLTPYLLTPYPTLMQPLKTFSPESIRAIARNPNIDLQPIGLYSKSDIQHHIQTQHFLELLTKMDTIQRQSIDQNLRKLAKLAGFSDIYAQDYSGYFKDIKHYIYLNGKKYRPQDISPTNNFNFVNSKNEFLAFLGWPYYILERLTILYAMFSFLGFLLSLLKGIYTTCAIYTQVNRQASVARILFAGCLEYSQHQSIKIF